MGYTAGSQPTGALWTQASLAVAALLSLRRILSRHLALLGLPVVLLWYNIRWSADKLAMAGGTPCKSSSNTIGVSQRGDGIGTQPFCRAVHPVMVRKTMSEYIFAHGTGASIQTTGMRGG